MAPRRRARPGGGPWPRPAGQKKRPGPDGAPGHGFRQRFAGNNGGQRGESLVGVMRTLVIGRDGKSQMWRIYAQFGENLGRPVRRHAAGHDSGRHTFHRIVIEGTWPKLAGTTSAGLRDARSGRPGRQTAPAAGRGGTHDGVRTGVLNASRPWTIFHGIAVDARHGRRGAEICRVACHGSYAPTN